MYKIIVTDKLNADAIEMLKGFGEVTYDTEIKSDELKVIIKDFDAIIVRSRTKVTADIINAATNLKVIGRAGVGVDNIDVKAATSRRIPVVFSPGGSTRSVVEIAVGLMVAMARDIVNLDNETKKGIWLKGKVEGTELHGKVIGIYGFGRIGRELAKICMAMGMKIHAYDPYVKDSDDAILYNDFNKFLSEIDILSVHAVLTSQTNHSIGTKEFNIMKKGIYIINLARGEIIDENSLINAIESGIVKGAALDVYEHEPPVNTKLVNFKNVIALPHIGAATAEAQKKSGTMIVKDVIAVLSGKKPESCVNSSILDG
ncbi:MAG: hydroxyacid dehydrogenase [Candidatus Thermoplasmatota archaeon]|nr:hydroxyacid dehydrogenase [Candidatus Thermoplasmatota archaeon]MCL5963288.1 hydroxyacid dehydrogenase [Candidatus Thermoplasmatota archaeon]